MTQTQPRSPAAAFDTLVADYYQAWFRFHPETAVDLGIPGYASLLRPYGDDDLGAQAALHEKLLNQCLSALQNGHFSR